MANIDIFENFENYIESEKFRAFLYNPANQLVRELEMINPVLNLRKVGYSTLDFQLPAKIFDLTDLSLESNDAVDYTLDGYEVEVWVGDLTDANGYDAYRFIIKSKPSSMSEEKPTFSFSAVSSEWELSKLPIINWPGVERKAYKQTSAIYTSQTQTGSPLNSVPLLTSDSSVGSDIALQKVPRLGTVTVTRAHTVYGVEIPLFPTTSDGTELQDDEYYLYENGGTWYVKAYVPANIKLPIDEAGTIQWNSPVDTHQYYIYYETEQPVTSGDLGANFEEAPFYQTDGLTINEIVEDLFANLQSIDSNMRHFLGWTYDTNSTQIDAIRSGISFNTTSVYDMLTSLAENYQVYIQYNTVQRTIKILPNDFGNNNGLRFEYGKYLKGVTQDFNVDNQINYVQGKDANNIGFADVSWSGDNYLENYTYQLDGVSYNGTSVSGLPSRWLSTELATELATRKYFQDQYREEVWGGNGKTGIVNIRYNLQEELAKKKLEIEEIEAEIEIKDGLIESYNNETDIQIKQNLDKTSSETAYNIPDKRVAGAALNLDLDIQVQPPKLSFNTLFTIPTTTKNFSTRFVKTFKLSGTPVNNIYARDDWSTPSEYYEAAIRIEFIKTQQVVHTVIVTMNQLSNEIMLDDNYEIDAIRISGRITPKFTLLYYVPLVLSDIELYSFDVLTTTKSWTNFVSRELFLKDELLVKRNQKQLEIDLIELGPNYILDDFDETAVINESNTYGIKQLEERLDHIRTFTSIDYDGLSEGAKVELKRIRRGQVYENTDIIDSKTLFEASETFLSENINPSITISIDSISILQAYEAQSDWRKVQIGEKVDIYVPDLKINIEAEIVEISIDFQNYATGLTIATTKNYDRTFGKYFSDVYNLLYETVENIVTPTSTATNNVVNYVENNQDALNIVTDPENQNVGFDTEGESNNSENFPNAIVSTEAYIDPRIGRLVSRPPVISIIGGGTFLLYGPISPGTAKLTNGGLYIKDENDNLRVKLTARDGLVAEQFQIDLDGNATFGGKLTAGATLSDGTTTIASKITQIDSLVGNLQNQIDGAISTWFGDVEPTLSNHPADQWTLDGAGDTDTYEQHIGDLFYDNITGYAYRFTYNAVEPSGDGPEDFTWIQISDSDIAAALAAAEAAMTFFTASNVTELNQRKAEAAEGDVLIPSVDFTDTAPDPDVVYYANTLYTFDGTDFLPEDKKAGSISGWAIGAENIESLNGQIVLHSDSEGDGLEPYIAMNKTGYADGNSGLFMGYVEDDQDPGTYDFKMDMGSPANYLRWTGSGLEIQGTLKQGSSIEGSLTKNVIITDGNRAINYLATGLTPTPNTLGTFTAVVYSNGEVITTGVSYAWTSGGVADQTEASSLTSSTFEPGLEEIYQSTASFVQVVVTFADSTTFTQSIPIVVTRDGQGGASGLNAYIHYAYATASDGSSGFTLTYTGSETYIGFYTDNTELDSTNYSDYQWSLFKGADGTGADGPGIVFRGLYDAAETYFRTATRRDVVQYPNDTGSYYAAKINNITGAFAAGNWDVFESQFSSVATGLLIAEESFVKNTINVGTNDAGNAANIAIAGGNNSPYISIGQDTQGYDNDGIFLGITTNLIEEVSSVSSAGSTSTVSTTISTGSKYFYKSTFNFFTNYGLGSWVKISNSVTNFMFGYITYLNATNPNHIGIEVTSITGSGTFNLWDLLISTPKMSLRGTQNNSLKWNGTNLDIEGDIGGTIGEINIGSLSGTYPTLTGSGIRITSAGIEAANSGDRTFFLSGATGSAEFSGTINANAGSIGTWNIDQGGLTSSISGNYTNIYPNGSAFFQSFQPTFINDLGGYAGNLSTYSLTLRGHLISFDRNTSGTVKPAIYSFDDLQINSELAMDITGQSGGINIKTTNNVSGNDITVQSRKSIYLEAVDGYIYGASNNVSSGTDYKILAEGVPARQVSTKLIKSNIQSINQNLIGEFLDKIEVKKYYNNLAETSGISLIIEDEIEKQNPFSDYLFSRNNGMARFKKLPDFLLPYKDNESLIKTEGEGENKRYIFSPMTINEYSLNSLSLASAKFNYNRIKQLEKENQNLKEIIAKILDKIGGV